MLTEKQSNILNIIKLYSDLYGHSPTLKELANLANIKTRSGVLCHIRALEKKGLLVNSGKIRFLNKIVFKKEFLEIPILGFANAGKPLVPAEESNLGKILVSKSLIPNKQCFGLIIKGDSMNKEILNGEKLENNSIAIVFPKGEVNNNDIVLAIIEDCATIKKIHKTDNLIILSPNSTNSEYKPIYLKKNDNFLIQGKVVACLKKV